MANDIKKYGADALTDIKSIEEARFHNDKLGGYLTAAEYRIRK